MNYQYSLSVNQSTNLDFYGYLELRYLDPGAFLLILRLVGFELRGDVERPSERAESLLAEIGATTRYVQPGRALGAERQDKDLEETRY